MGLQGISLSFNVAITTRRWRRHHQEYKVGCVQLRKTWMLGGKRFPAQRRILEEVQPQCRLRRVKLHVCVCASSDFFSSFVRGHDLFVLLF